MPHNQSLYNKPVLIGSTVRNWRILLEQSFTAHVPLLMATSTSGIERRCYSNPQHCLPTLSP